jgi:adenylate cyclase
MLAIVALLAVGVGIAIKQTGASRSLNNSSIDVRFTIRGHAMQPPNMAIVAIDGATFSYFSEHHMASQWPFPRRYYARVLDDLHRAGARVIAVDIQFTEPTDQTDDNDLYNAVGNDHPVVLGTADVEGNGQTEILGGNANLKAAGASPGDTVFYPDPDGVIRKTRYSIQGLKTFGVAVAGAYRGRSVPKSWFGGATKSVPIDFAYPEGKIPNVSMYKFWTGGYSPAMFRGKIVFVGATDPTLQDVHATPTDPTMPGAELQANATNTVLHELPLSYASGALAIILIVLFGLVQPLASMRLPRLWSVWIAVAVGVLYVVAVQLAFDSGLILDLVDPLVALAVGLVGTLAVLYLVETVERERVRSLFARFTPAPVVDEVLARTDGNLRLGAVERECTVLFSDLRGFTAFSETQPPERVIAVVNVYLEQMTEAILAAGGTLIAYMGDGIMALFGAPLEQPDHADRALTAAREMVGPRLERFNSWMIEQGHASRFRMGVGLNSGPVMAGNVGSDERLDYTAIGDTTNTASRLEGMTKGTDYMLLLSEATRERLSRPPEDLVFVDELSIRGRDQKIRVWSLSVAKVTPPSEVPASPAEPDTAPVAEPPATPA